MMIEDHQTNLAKKEGIKLDERIINTELTDPNEDLTNYEIRQIKLNYISMNKRAGTSYVAKRA
jgi:hypothetical protein